MNKTLQKALYKLRKDNPWFGATLQSINIHINEACPTMGVAINKDFKRWELYVNPKYIEKNTNDENVAVLTHECYHIVHNHITRNNLKNLNKEQIELANIAMDLEINQLIQNLPKNCVSMDWFKEYKFEPLREWEYYYNILIKDPSKIKPQGGGEGKDEHYFTEGELDEQTALEATKDLILRVQDQFKKEDGYDKTPDKIKDLLKDIQTRLAKLDYKRILQLSIRKSLPANHTRKTWSRKSRRHGNQAPGNITAENPKIDFHLDTSGSISYETLCECVDVVANFLKVGASKCNINLFHTEIYYKTPFKKGMKLEKSVLECGGTDLEPSLRQIEKNKPDLAIILTDGCYEHVVTKNMTKTIFIITKDGTTNHPFAKEKWAVTVQMK